MNFMYYIQSFISNNYMQGLRELSLEKLQK